MQSIKQLQKIILVTVPLAPLVLTGCMSANPVRPVLTCEGSCTYFGPQQPDPRVEMARVLTGGISTVAGIFVGGDVLTSLGKTSGAVSSTIERNTNNNNTSSLVERSSDSVRDISSVNNTSNTNNATTTTTTTTSSVNNTIQ